MNEPEVKIEQRFMTPTEEYPMGSYLRIVGGNVEMATGIYEKEYPGHPSLDFHGGPPFVMFNCGSGEMRTFPWSKSSNPVDDSLPEMHPGSE